VCTLTGHSHIVTSVAYSPDGKHIVSGSYVDGGPPRGQDDLEKEEDSIPKQACFGLTARRGPAGFGICGDEPCMEGADFRNAAGRTMPRRASLRRKHQQVSTCVRCELP
jgi:hypothetical protein